MATSTWGTSWGTSWGSAWGAIGEAPKAGLTINRPSYRSIDAKTLADSFNRGVAEIPDYEYPSGRRFYQDEE